MKTNYTYIPNDGTATKGMFLDQGDNTYNAKPINTTEHLERLTHKRNWRIIELPSGYFQAEFQGNSSWYPMTRRETVDLCEEAIDASIEHYKTRMAYGSAHETARREGPKVAKTFD